MRCLANAMLLNDNTRQIFLDLDYSPKAAERMKNDDRDDEFLATRILFFTTYTGKLNIEALLKDNDLAGTITTNLDRHAKRLSSSNTSSNPMTEMSLQETLKLIPNVIYHHSASATLLDTAITPIIDILKTHVLPSRPLQPPISLLINALMNLNLSPTSQIEDSSIRDSLFPDDNPTHLTAKLVNILDAATTAYPERDLDTTLSPLIALFRKLYVPAPSPVRQSLQSLLLPAPSSRSQPLGTDASLPSRLLRLTLSPLTPMLRENIASLLYELSDEDPEKLVSNIGYGYAAGFLSTRGIEVPASAMATTADAGAGNGGVESGSRVDINPVTGQRRDMEEPDEGPEMTDEEKEREAERLFVLFERLRATGVVDVENPVTKAMREGQSD